MPEALIPLAGSIIGGLTSKKSSTPATQTASKDPWAPAQPWMLENIKQGQALQGQYQANPFSDLQKNSYSNQFQNTDQMRALAQQLLGGLGKPQAFDRYNPSVKPTLPFDLSALFQAQQARQAQPQAPQATQGLLGAAFTQAQQMPSYQAPAPQAPQMMPQQATQEAQKDTAFRFALGNVKPGEEPAYQQWYNENFTGLGGGM